MDKKYTWIIIIVILGILAYGGYKILFSIYQPTASYSFFTLQGAYSTCIEPSYLGACQACNWNCCNIQTSTSSTFYDYTFTRTDGGDCNTIDCGDKGTEKYDVLYKGTKIGNFDGTKGDMFPLNIFIGDNVICKGNTNICEINKSYIQFNPANNWDAGRCMLQTYNLYLYEDMLNMTVKPTVSGNNVSLAISIQNNFGNLYVQYCEKINNAETCSNIVSLIPKGATQLTYVPSIPASQITYIYPELRVWSSLASMNNMEVVNWKNLIFNQADIASINFNIANTEAKGSFIGTVLGDKVGLSSQPCTIPADTDCNGKVDRAELGIAINSWISGTMSRTDLGQAINSWVNG